MERSEFWSDLLAIFLPPPRITVSEYAESERILSPEACAEPGRWRNARAPHTVMVMDAMSPSDPCQQVAVMFSSQTAKTEVLLTFAAFIVRLNPGPILAIQPNVTPMGERFSKTRVAPMIRDMPTLARLFGNPKSRNTDNTIMEKSFPGGTLMIIGANSPAGLASVPVQYLLCDEIDRWTTTNEGDPLDLARKRTARFPRRKIVLTSSPTRAGVGIHAEYTASEQQYELHLKCLHCGQTQRPQMRHLTWDDGSPDTVRYACEHCGGVHDSATEARIKAAPVWVCTRNVGWRTKGFWASQLAVLLASWADTVREYLSAKDDPSKLQVFRNTGEAEVWEDRSRSLRGDVLASRAEFIPLRTIQPGYLILTLGIDVQPDRLSCSLWAWGRGERCWLVDRMIIPGDPNQSDVWERLDAFRKGKIRNDHGVELPVSMTAIDTAGSNTHAVYAYVRSRKHERVIGIKGASVPGKPVINRPSKVDVNWAGQMIKRGAEVWVIGVDTAKQALVGRLVSDMSQADVEKRFVRWPAGLSDDYFSELSAEVYDPRLKRWTLLKGRRNEALDEFVYAFAAAQHPFVRIGSMSENDWSNLRLSLEPAGNGYVPAVAPVAERDPESAPSTPIMVSSPLPPPVIQRGGPTAARIW